MVASRTKLSEKLSLWIVIILLTILNAGMYYLIGAKVSNEAPALYDSLRSSVEEVKITITTSEIGQKMLERIPPKEDIIQKGDEKEILGKAVALFSSTLGIIANVLIFIALSLFIATSPQAYIEGIKKLFPQQHRERVDQVLNKLSTTLFRWLAGRLIDMIVLGICTGLGLWALGIPLALTLGVLTAILSFVPNIGPFLAAVAPVLVAFTKGTDKVIYVIILFIVIQLLESYLLTPYIQKKAVEVPPVTLLVGQIILTVLAGGMGLLLATPLIACLMVLVNMLFIEEFIEKKLEAG